MGFLHKLWDETLAGPAPETGLAKLRKYDSLSSSSSPRSPTPLVIPPFDDQIPVTRSITIIRTGPAAFRNVSAADSGSLPSSPAGTSTPTASPFSPRTPRGDFKRFTRRKSSMEEVERAEPRSPTVYDWIVISALDR